MDAASNSRVLITGGRGFIGRAVVKLLQRTGYRVVSLDVSSATSARGHDRESAREIVCDVSDAVQLEEIFKATRFGGIIHLAAVLPTMAQRKPLRATQVNVDGSVHLLELAQRFGVPRFVFGSSLSIYGTRAADHVVSEFDRAAPEDLYGSAKLYVEQLGKVYGDRDGLEFASLRIGRVVGPGGKSATSAWRSQIFGLIGAGHPVKIALPYVETERILLVHVDDVARMLVALLQADRPNHVVYNALCESMTVSDLKRDVEALNSNVTIKAGEEHARGNPRLLDSSRFAQEFGFATAPIREYLRKAAENKS
jgi:nucleoside-diphosphate-sugar epimerase